LAGNTVTVVANLTPTFSLSAAARQSSKNILVDLSWYDPERLQQPASYTIWRQEQGSAPTAVGTENTPMMWTDTDAQDSHTYTYTVVVGDAQGNGFISYPCRITIGQGPQPDACATFNGRSLHRPSRGVGQIPGPSELELVASLLGAACIVSRRRGRE
jgi:fibronectin type 3 domain-containing protein